MEDGFIRNAYFGGATDIYKAYGENLHYYDVNSLYPHAMLKPMPHKISYFIKDMSNVRLEDLFGFCKAKVTIKHEPFKILIDNIYQPIKVYNGSIKGISFKDKLVKYNYIPIFKV